jgi:twitching motility protein PilT
MRVRRPIAPSTAVPAGAAADLPINPVLVATDQHRAMALDSNEHLLGRMAVHTKLITPEQLNEATREQGRTGGRIRLGEILVAKGFITPRKLEKLLAAQKQLLAKRAAERAGCTVEALVPAPEPGAPAEDGSSAAPEARGAASTGPSEDDPRAAPPHEPAAAARGKGPGQAAVSAGATPAAATDVSPGAGRELDAILREAVAAGASDVHLHAGSPLRWRRHGILEPRPGPALAPERAESLLRTLLTPEQAARLDAEGQLDLACARPGIGRFRVSVYRQQRGLDGVFRALPDHPPTLSELGLPSTLARLVNFHQGMVLVTGPAGCGKSATLAALLNLVNEERTDHILTIEDPIEIVHPSKRGLVNQRQVRVHTESFARALRAGLREDPDVIAIGELRDLETISLALTAAETGHLVLGTLHTNSTIRTIERLVGAFPPDQQGQVRTMLSESLRAVVSQRLVRSADGAGRVPALEVLLGTKAVANLIRENKTFQIRSILQTGAAHGMCLLDASLEELVRSGAISRDEARRHAEDPKRFGGAAA